MKLNFYQRCQGSGEDIKYGRHGQCNNHIHLSEICCLLSPCEIPAQANANLAWSTSGPRAVVNETGVSCCPEVYGELKNKRPVSVVIQQCPNTTYVALLRVQAVAKMPLGNATQSNVYRACTPQLPRQDAGPYFPFSPSSPNSNPWGMFHLAS